MARTAGHGQASDGAPARASIRSRSTNWLCRWRSAHRADGSARRHRTSQAIDGSDPTSGAPPPFSLAVADCSDFRVGLENSDSERAPQLDRRVTEATLARAAPPCRRVRSCFLMGALEGRWQFRAARDVQRESTVHTSRVFVRAAGRNCVSPLRGAWLGSGARVRSKRLRGCGTRRSRRSPARSYDLAVLHGRGQEHAAIDAVVEGGHRSQGGSLLLRCEPGERLAPECVTPH